LNFVVSKKTPKFVSTKSSEYRLVSKRGSRPKKAAGADTPSTMLPTMTAHEPTSVAGIESDDTTTAAQTHFDSRDRLAGRLDDATVRHAAGGDL